MAKPYKVFCPRGFAALAVLTLLIALANVAIDWYSFLDFYNYGSQGFMIAFGVVCGIASVLLIWEIWISISALRFYVEAAQTQAGGRQAGGALKERCRKVLRRQEAVSLAVLLLQDIPVVIIDFGAFQEGPCKLYRRLFEDSITGTLILAASFCSALWELLMAFRLCFRCDYKPCKPAEKGLGGIGWFCLRLWRPMFAVLVLGFSAFVFVPFITDDNSRQDCSESLNSTMSPNITDI